jgi:hypothetical protein
MRVGPLAAAALAAQLSGCHDDNVYHVGGTVSGLVAGNEVTLLNNGGDATTVAADGSFTFSTKVSSYSKYDVTIGTQPAGQMCVVAQGTGSGVAKADVTGVSVSCDSWTKTGAPAVNPSAITISADATYLSVAEKGGGILVSTDGGATWTRTRAPTGTWAAITSSADGAFGRGHESGRHHLHFE